MPKSKTQILKARPILALLAWQWLIWTHIGIIQIKGKMAKPTKTVVMTIKTKATVVHAV